MKTKRELKRGDIFLNLWARWKTTFIYMGTNQRVCYGITLVEFKGKREVQEAQYYEESLQDAERFQLIGHIDLSDDDTVVEHSEGQTINISHANVVFFD